MDKIRETMNEMNKNTHCYEVLEYLILAKEKGITSMEAFSNLGITRLSAVIFQLKNHYHIPIGSNNINYTARNGRRVVFSRYYLLV